MLLFPRLAWRQEARATRHFGSRKSRILPDGNPNQNSISIAGDVLVFIHGYNNGLDIIMQRRRQLAKDLEAEGWKGIVIGFDWPSGNETLAYWEDRSRASSVAVQLVRNCVTVLAKGQEKDCVTNVHLLCHSTGAYVAMEAFEGWRPLQKQLAGKSGSVHSCGRGFIKSVSYR